MSSIFESDIVLGDSSSALNILVHPLVIVNVSDQYTRTQIQEEKVNPVVYGALLGTQDGRNVEIQTSFEIQWSPSEAGEVIFDIEKLKERHEQLAQVFTDYELLGWYSTGDYIGDVEMDLHEQLIDSGVNENPLYLILNPSSQNKGELPLSLYESELRIIDQVPKSIFVRNMFKIVSSEAERVAVDHVAHDGGGVKKGSSLPGHIGGLQNAIRMLGTRLQTLVAFLVAMEQGKIPVDHCLLRHINALCNRLPVADGPDFRAEILNEYNDALLIAYLATVTKGANTINEMLDKFSICYERQSRRRQFGM